MQVLEDYMEEVRREKIMNGEISLLGVMQVRQSRQSGDVEPASRLNAISRSELLTVTRFTSEVVGGGA